MKLVRPEVIAEHLGKSRNLIDVQAHDFRKAYGKYPKWFIHSRVRGKTMIDYDLYIKRVDLPHKAYLYATNKLYWTLLATNHTNSDMARIMAKRSKYFKDVNSWTTFFSSGLFKGASQALIRPTLLTEFVKCGTKYLYLLKKSGRLDISKQGEYYN